MKLYVILTPSESTVRMKQKFCRLYTVIHKNGTLFISTITWPNYYFTAAFSGEVQKKLE